MIAAIDASGWATIVGAVFLGLAQLAGLWFAFQRYKLTVQKVESVKAVLEKTDLVADKKLDSIHTLVNSSMGKQLSIAASLSRRIALDHPEDLEAAKQADHAEALLQEHESRQTVVDSKVDAFPQKP